MNEPSTPNAPSVLASALGIFAITFLVYTLGACRTIYVGDSGELVAAAATLGIPHPSGYPLYVLLGHLWIALVPVSTPAFAMSLFSAFFASASCALLFALVRWSGASTVAGLGAALFLAFSPSFWSQANVQRVYSLNAFLLLAVVAAALAWHRQRRLRWMALAAFFAGLGAANHTVMLVVGGTVGLFAVASDRGWLRRPLDLLVCVGAGLAGLLPYLYLPWRSGQQPRLDWGNPETLDAFLDVVLRRDFWHRSWQEGPADLLVVAGDYFWSLGAETGVVGLLLALLGLAWGLGRWPVVLPAALMLANLAAVGLHGSRSDIFIWHRYYIPSYAMLALLAGWGLHRAEERWGRRARALLLVPVVLLVVGWSQHDRSDFTLADDFSRTLLQTLPPGAHLAASDDNILFVLIYLHLAEGLRPDVDLIMQGVGDANLPTLRFDPDEDPLYFTHHPNWNTPGLEVVPMGLVFRTVRSDSPRPEPVIPKPELQGAWDPSVPKDYLSQNLIGHFHMMLGMTFEERDWPRARAEFDRATEAAPRNDVLFYNLGLIYQRNGLPRRALDAFARATEINPRHIPSANPVRPIDKLGELRAEVEALANLEGEILAPDGAVPTVPDAVYHRRMAEALERRGQPLWARGHRLLALELETSSGGAGAGN